MDRSRHFNLKSVRFSDNAFVVTTFRLPQVKPDHAMQTTFARPVALDPLA
jgi:hypothetical protein